SLPLHRKPPQAPPNTFTHVPFGKHRLTATLANYDPLSLHTLFRAQSLHPFPFPNPFGLPTELAAFSVQTEPAGASILLDGKPPQEPPNTFTHVPFGKHRLTATLDNYEPITQDLQVREGMSPKIVLK